MKIYLASSWRNEYQPEVLDALRLAGHEVYDFRNPSGSPLDTGFHWSEIDPQWQDWTKEQYIEGLTHPLADSGFGKDMTALDWSEMTVCLLPCGKSAHLEAGYAAGQGKPVVFCLAGVLEPELMYKMGHQCVTNLDELLWSIDQLQIDRTTHER